MGVVRLLVAAILGVGILKYVDDVFTCLKGPVKAIGKNIDDIFSGIAKYGDDILKGLKKNMDDLVSDIAKKAGDAMKSLLDVGTEDLDEGLEAAGKVVKETGEGGRKINFENEIPPSEEEWEEFSQQFFQRKRNCLENISSQIRCQDQSGSSTSRPT